MEFTGIGDECIPKFYREVRQGLFGTLKDWDDEDLFKRIETSKSQGVPIWYVFCGWNLDLQGPLLLYSWTHTYLISHIPYVVLTS